MQECRCGRVVVREERVVCEVAGLCVLQEDEDGKWKWKEKEEK